VPMRISFEAVPMRISFEAVPGKASAKASCAPNRGDATITTISVINRTDSFLLNTTCALLP
jgi:hypothetical protein